MTQVSGEENLLKLQARAEKLLKDLSTYTCKLSDHKTMNECELKVSQLAAEYADTIAAIQLQKYCNQEDAQEGGKQFVKQYVGRAKNMGARCVKLRFSNGTEIGIVSTYYHRKATLKKHQGKKGVYPVLMMMGINGALTAAFASKISLIATAASSFVEGKTLLNKLLNTSVDQKQMYKTVKRIATIARAQLTSGQNNFTEDLSNCSVVVSTDGGRLRIRKDKRGARTKKNRRRYKTDWREPKLIIIYVVDESGQRDANHLPIIDASIQDADATFGMLTTYLKQLKANLAAKLMFISDGARWIWDRVHSLAEAIEIDRSKCWYGLDFYHAVEHLSNMAAQFKWQVKTKKQWLTRHKNLLLAGQWGVFIQGLQKACKWTRNKVLKNELGYFERHAEHMRYAVFKDAGLPRGSGAIESAVRRVVNLRLKGAGIFWHEESANAMLLLRSYYKAGRWDWLQNLVSARIVAL